LALARFSIVSAYFNDPFKALRRLKAMTTMANIIYLEMI